MTGSIISGRSPRAPSDIPIASLRSSPNLRRWRRSDRCTLQEVLLVLSRSLLEVAVPPPVQRYGRVFVAPIEAARGLSFDTVFVPGLAEKMFPGKIAEEPMLLDAARRQIGTALQTNDDRVASERLQLSIAAGAAERRLLFSYPRINLEQGRPRVPSFYALEVVRAAEQRLPNFAELAERAETATSSRLGWPAPIDPARRHRRCRI